MSIQTQVSIRTRMLGVLIRDARLSTRKTLTELAKATGVTEGILRSWEEGRRAPSLPELEVVAFALKLPLEHFWKRESRSGSTEPADALNLPMLVKVRQRLVGAMLRQEREKNGLALRTLADQSGIPMARIKSYELGERPIPVPELEALLGLFGGQIDRLFDQSGPIGAWMAQQKTIQDFKQMDPELQAFVSKPVNRPYLELALKLSNMSTEKLRTVAENLLDITF